MKCGHAHTIVKCSDISISSGIYSGGLLITQLLSDS